jgi:hypothetical protein
LQPLCGLWRASTNKGIIMVSADYCIESNHPVVNRFLPQTGARHVFADPSVAVAIAAKCVPNPFGDEVRVVHLPSGEVIFRAASPLPAPMQDA